MKSVAPVYSATQLRGYLVHERQHGSALDGLGSEACGLAWRAQRGEREDEQLAPIDVSYHAHCTVL